MGDLLGIIAPLKKFMSNSDEEVYVTLEGKKKTVLSLVKIEYMIFRIFRER